MKLDNEQDAGKVRVCVEFGMDTLPHGWDMAGEPTPWKVVPQRDEPCLDEEDVLDYNASTCSP